MQKTLTIQALNLGIIFLTIVGCSENKKLERRLRGDWNVTGKNIKTHIYQKDSLSAVSTLTGSCSFSSNKTGTCEFEVSLSYTYIDSLNNQYTESTSSKRYLQILHWEIKENILYITTSRGAEMLFEIIETYTNYFHLKQADRLFRIFHIP
ncbi:MAG: hypothetical protein GXO48_05940 [Chlorobi bacterium]|nr:hypothetical protein [Chlorobiota bacterium]